MFISLSLLKNDLRRLFELFGKRVIRNKTFWGFYVACFLNLDPFKSCLDFIE